ncbi:hypothetical protein [uncultured Nisaea sp.]|jgi:hypothetical protein|uniref:hypothetical protein n=1 Tax=uncultured Nisaea sp. TaxID=538215 RepID=UPI0030EDA0BE|tara:strand:+ start:1224 stop:1610 length:387 start_codon:yes stop_codon:yes gene_type:complete
MAKDYAQTKALEALEATGNNRRESALLLRVWAESDDKLKSALVAPFLNNLCALAVQRALSSHTGRRKPASKRARPKDNAATLLEAISKSGAQTMSSTRNSAPPPQAGSARHKQAVTLLAAAFKPSGKS